MYESTIITEWGYEVKRDERGQVIERDLQANTGSVWQRLQELYVGVSSAFLERKLAKNNFIFVMMIIGANCANSHIFLQNECVGV